MIPRPVSLTQPLLIPELGQLHCPHSRSIIKAVEVLPGVMTLFLF